MTYRKTKSMFYRIFALVALIVIAALLCPLAFAFSGRAHADTASEHDKVFGTSEDHGGATPLSAAVKELPSGNYYLTDDITLTQMVEFFQQENVKLCLHGHTITISSNHIFKIYSNSTLNLYDCGGAENCGAVRGGKGVYIMGGTLNMYGGAIKDASGGYYLGGGVTVSGGGTFNMYDGAISGNSASGDGGGGVNIGYNGTFNMYGGTISNNTVTNCNGAGVCVNESSSTFHMYGGTITNNTINCTDGKDPDSVYGAGVDFRSGVFTIEGDAVISGNVKGPSDAKEINNVEIGDDCKIEISGPLGDNARIGVTTSSSAFTDGYTSSGNTKNPSEFFSCDDGSQIDYDPTNREVGVGGGAVDTDRMDDAWVDGYTEATVGDTEVTFTITVKLKNGNEVSDAITVPLDSPLHSGGNLISFVYSYKGEPKSLSYSVVPKKLHVNVVWSFSKGLQTGRHEYKCNYDGNDILSSVSASYTNYSGEQVRIHGSWETEAILVVDEEGNSVSAAGAVGVYKFYLAPSSDYEFDNNLLTVTVVGQEDDGYYQMQDAWVIGPVGVQTVGDTSVTVTIERKLVHTKDESEKTDRVNYNVRLTSPLHVGSNTIDFDYKYNDMGGGVQTKSLSVPVTAVKKTVSVVWYFYDSAVSTGSANHVYDGVDASGKIVAEYDGTDGSKKRVDGTSALMIRKDGSGNAVTSMSGVGVYSLSLADDPDYVFENNSFTYTVVEDLADITDLVYKESGKTILGVSCAAGFENGTELAVKRVECDANIIDGDIVEALDVRFVKDSAEVAPSGKVTVHVLIPDELRSGKTYNIYNVKNGVATKVKYSIEGNYAIFDSYELSCIVFATPKNAPPPVDPDDPDDPNHGDDPNHEDDPPGDKGGNKLTWLWILLAIIAVGIIVFVVVFIVLDRKKKSKTVVVQTKPARVCSVCGKQNEEAAKFCKYCGGECVDEIEVQHEQEQKEQVEQEEQKEEKAKEEKAEQEKKLEPKEKTKQKAPARKEKPETKSKEPEQKSTKPCPSCGKENEAVAVFCKYCGNKFEQ